MHLRFLIFLIIFTNGLYGVAIFSQKLWNKQRIISEVVKNYLISCQRLDILKNYDNLKKVVQTAHKQKVNFLDQIEILVDLSKFCGEREIMSAKFGELDCFEMLKSKELFKLFDEYKIHTDKSEKSFNRLKVCKLLFRMDRPKVSEKDVKVLIFNFFTNKNIKQINIGSKNNKPESFTNNEEKENKITNTAKILYNDNQLVLTNSDATYLLWKLENLLNNLYHPFQQANIPQGFQTNVKTRVNIKENGNTNVRMQTSISSKRFFCRNLFINFRLNGNACKVLHADMKIINLVEKHVNKNIHTNVDIVFISIKNLVDQILKKFNKQQNYFGLTDNSAQNKFKSRCIADLLLLTVIIEFYKSLVKATAHMIENISDDSYIIFCQENEPNCSKNDLLINLFELDRKADLLSTCVNSWFEYELTNDIYKEWQKHKVSNINGHFTVLIVGNIKPKHNGFLELMGGGLNSIKSHILPSAMEVNSEKRIRNRRHHFYYNPRSKRPIYGKHKSFYLVDELPRPAFYYQKKFKKRNLN